LLEPVAGYSAQMFKVPECVAGRGLGRFHLNANDASVVRFEDDIDFLTVAIAVVVQARWGRRPGQLTGDLADSEVLQ
jgi:hypothetical protein